jgi:triosephosphate isomerase
MNGTRAEAEALTRAVAQGVDSGKHTEVLLCPPFVLIPLVADLLKGGKIAWGGQDLNVHVAGAHTGEVSGPMLRDFGCRYVIVGHSERRALYGESDQLVAQKFKAAQDAGLIPILCVGETLAEREANETEKVVARQLDAVTNLVGIGALANSVLAYEPVWAIGTGKTATPQQAQDVHRFIRAKLAGLDKGIAAGLRILYGGSVKGSNATELFGQADIDGGLIGGASLNAEEFLTICRAGG